MMMNVNQFPDRLIEIDKTEFLYFGGTAYLGLATHKLFQKIVSNNIKKWGTSYGSSRNANIQLTAYDIAEKFLAKHIQAKSALTVSSGSLAGKLVIEQLTKQDVTFFHLPNHHNAIQAQVSFPVWIDNKLNPKLLNTQKEKIVILTDAIPTSTIKPIDLSFINFISDDKEISLVIDESHSLGIIGQNGCGLFSSITDKKIKNKIMISSLGKGFGITGGVIAGNDEFINQIKEMGNFVSAAGMNPAFAVSILDAKDIYQNQLAKLRNNLAYVYKHLKTTSSEFDINYPIIYPKNKDTYDILKAENIIITNFKYPNELGYLNRIVITANHQKKDLKKLISILNRL
jgi:7-keto-8-aminopelargonate synthetase-like enzyme